MNLIIMLRDLAKLRYWRLIMTGFIDGWQEKLPWLTVGSQVVGFVATRNPTPLHTLRLCWHEKQKYRAAWVSTKSMEIFVWKTNVVKGIKLYNFEV